MIKTGKQTKITENINKIAQKMSGDDISLVNQISQNIHSMKVKDKKGPDFTRTADEILKSGWCSGCHEEGVVFSALLRVKGIPNTYIQALDKNAVKSFDKNNPNLKGHVFLRAKLNGKQKIINSTTGEITDKLPKYMIVGAEGLDSWDIGLSKGFEDLKKLFVVTRDEEHRWG